MATQGGFGLVCQIDVSTTPTTWAKIRDIDIPAFKNFMAEATTHDSTGGYYEALATGKRQVEPFNVNLAWDVSQGTHAAVLTAFDAGTAVTFSVADPEGDETIVVEVVVEVVKRNATQEDIFNCDVTLHPTGQPTIS